MALRRGFLAEANKYALEFRNELQLAPHAPLCPWSLAGHLEIPIAPISRLKGMDEIHYKFFKDKKCPVSAAAVPISKLGRVIIYNDHHPLNRQSNSIAHEVAHIVLRHPAAQITHADGTRKFDSVLEEEASNLGAILLVPDKAAQHIVFQEISLKIACTEYKVSGELMEWRLNKSGARRILQNRLNRNGVLPATT